MKYADGNGQKVAPASVKRRVGQLQALLTHAFSQRWIEANTGAGIRIEGYFKNTGTKRPFLDDELGRLFASDLFVKPERWSSSRETVSDRTLAWLFLLGLTNGARIEEIGQTELANVKTDGGVRYLDLGADARVKNETSRRMIPLHGQVLQFGFDDYVAALHEAGETRLFPELKPNKFDKLCQAASRVANRVVDRIVGDDPRVSFHNLRHNFKDLARDATIEKYILNQVMGHAGFTAGDRYGIGARLKTLSGELDRVTFDMIEWEPIIRAFGGVDWAKTALSAASSSFPIPATAFTVFTIPLTARHTTPVLGATAMPDGRPITVADVGDVMEHQAMISFACAPGEEFQHIRIERHVILVYRSACCDRYRSMPPSRNLAAGGGDWLRHALRASCRTRSSRRRRANSSCASWLSLLATRVPPS